MARSKWLEKYRQGSFRGVPFFIVSHQVLGGRRKQDREFAKRDLGNSEDLGRKLKSFSLELFVLGDDYFTLRDNLEEALNAEGPGRLIHPYRGTISVQAGSYTLSETVGEGRLARFSVQFSESGEVRFPDQVLDDLNGSIENAETLIDDSKGFFASALNTANQVAFVVQAAADDIAAVVDTLEAAFTAVTAPIASLTRALSELKADINDLLALPGELADRFDELWDDFLGEFSDEPETSERIFSNFQSSIDANFEDVIGETPSRQTQRGNQAVIREFSKQINLSNQAKAAVEVDFASTQAAIESRDLVIQGLDDQLVLVTDDDLFQDIRDLQTSLSRALPRTGTTELIKITPPQTIPALVIAYAEFEDLEKENEIIDQNAIEHPGFVPGGEEIEVSAG